MVSISICMIQLVFACMKVAFNDILEAWKAEAIDYKRGAYSMWGNFKKIKSPSQTEIYQETARIMKNRYLNGQSGVWNALQKQLLKTA